MFLLTITIRPQGFPYFTPPRPSLQAAIRKAPRGHQPEVMRAGENLISRQKFPNKGQHAGG